MSESIIIVGAGGHARVVAATLAQAGWQLCGVLDKTRSTIGEIIQSTTIVGSYEELPEWRMRGTRHAFPALGDNAERKAMMDRLRSAGFEVPAVIHPRAMLEPGARVGSGTLVCVGAILCADAAVGEACIINSGAIVEHETAIASNAHVAPGCRLAGRVKVGEGAFVGIGAVVKERISIGAWAVIGAGSVVVDDIPPSVVAYGVPAKVMHLRSDGDHR